MQHFMFVIIDNNKLRWIAHSDKQTITLEKTVLFATAFTREEMTKIQNALSKALSQNYIVFCAIECDNDKLLTDQQKDLINAN